MTEETSAKVSSDQSTASNESSQTRQRKKRKWDQPAESLVSAGLLVPGVVPLGNIGSLGGVTVPGVTPMNPLAACGANVPQVNRASLLGQHTAAVVAKLIQPKIQDELIAREIVINDAESSLRYKLTKRQTQEEIQKCTGAVVITRGRYRPPNGPADGEKPLYLHISAGADLKDMAERILAVDRAAAMVEEMLKQGENLPATFHPLSNGAKGTQAISTCVFLGFDVDPSLNIAARIRGPNDQYINHIMNETGATVVLRGQGSGSVTHSLGEEGQQPLHLFLSSNNSKSLEDAKRLAEHLLNTISVECSISRVSSSKVYSALPPPQQVYSAVPPPQQLLAGVKGSGNNIESTSATGVLTSTVATNPMIPLSLVAGFSTSGNVSQSGGYLNCGQSQPELASYSQSQLSVGTSYIGYGGIYPQATPLQQVAQALKQSSLPFNSTVAPTTSLPSNEPKSSINSNTQKDKRPPQRRKFQELPIGSKGSANPIQVREPRHWSNCNNNSVSAGYLIMEAPSGRRLELQTLLSQPILAFMLGSEFLKPVEPSANWDVRNVSSMPAPKKLVSSTTNGMPPPPSRTMAPPPPPPKFNSSTHAEQSRNNTKIEPVPVVSDTLVKLLEYGEDDDDPEETNEEPPGKTSGAVAASKPFWAV